MPIPNNMDLFLPVPRTEPPQEEKNKKGVYYQILDANKEEVTALHEISFLMQILSSQKGQGMGSPALIALAEFLDKNVFNSDFIKKTKLEKDITKEEHKNIVKKKWYEKTLGYFHKLATATGDFWKQLMMGILALAIFDPKGKILKMVINFLVKAITWVINAIADNLPMILQNAIYITTEVLPDVLRKLIDGVFDALSGMFAKWAKDLPEGSTLKLIFGGLSDLFGKDSPLRDFLKWISKLLPVFVVGVAVVKAFLFLQKIYNIIMTISGTILTVLTSAAFWWILAIVAVIWILKDVIAGFFDYIIDWFMGLGTVAKIVIGTIAAALAILFWPITLVIAAIYGLAKVLQLLSTSAGREKLVKFFKALGKIIIKSVIGWFTFLGNVIKILFTKGFKSAIGYVLDSIVNWIAGILPESWGKSFLELWDSLKKSFDDLINWFVTMWRVGPIAFFRMNDEKRAKAKEFVKLQRDLETAKEDNVKLPDAVAKIESARGDDFDKLLKAYTSADKDKTKEFTNTIKESVKIVKTNEAKGKAAIKVVDTHDRKGVRQ